MELQLLLGVDASGFGVAQLAVAVAEQVVYLLVESLAFVVLFPDHFQDTFVGGDKNTYHARPPRSSNSGALAFSLVVFVEVVHLALFLHCGAGVASLDLAPG